eukprot:TRINITY_DN8091_c0_g1_i1.p1 TRINITY_DN8091_c0_g1~~TRINITY_DN8091_c0_g1_i1.p1  ORF type:complete len:321 (-),score=49.53 TRINITY_DN8091_c0_g1_i1:27-989(-)
MAEGSLDSVVEWFAGIKKQALEMPGGPPKLTIESARQFYENLLIPTFKSETKKMTATKIEEVVINTKTELGGIWVTAGDITPNENVFLHLHGGGFSILRPKHFVRFLEQLSAQTSSRIFSVDYRRAPTHPFPIPISDCVEAYTWVLSQGYKADNVTFIGGSAGGNLTLTVALACKNEGIPLPAALIPISPWTNFRCNADSIERNSEKDVMLGGTDMKEFLLDVTGYIPRPLYNNFSYNPLCSPVYANCKGLPPTIIFAARGELLFDDSVQMHEKLIADGVQSKLHAFNHGIHCWITLFDSPETTKAIEIIAAFTKVQTTK